ncbi:MULTISPECIES: helix-turn-helix transcriptional regulator [Saccharibacillus]|uniref:helix-turn-helix transcriptional regulator n=1 Tax=Saccharibacillus TaxID=456492 RepID=UPI0012385205|nr:YafY family protein [Saccharibacillus sp. WB 17]MWJ30117.1 WYL domain-containing protein [Saccharibacillus sp. WB 17]
MEKIERLLSIILILLRKEIVPSREFAQLFGVTKRTILRDMETLSLSNIPIYAVAGAHGGYGIMDTYKMDKRLLSSADLENILTALGGLEQILFGEEVEITIKKIEAMVNPAAPRGTVRLSFYDWAGRSELRHMLKSCQEAISGKKVLAFDYIDKNGTATHRTVEPAELHFSENSWYLHGFCLQRMDTRLFKLTRMDRLVLDSQTFVPRAAPSKPAAQSGYRPELADVRALISPAVQDRFIERYGRQSVEPYDDEWLLASFRVPQSPVGFQFLAGFGTNLKITEPADYAAEFRAYVAKMLSLYT